MANTISSNISSYTVSSNSSSTTKKVMLSDELKDYLENSSSSSKKVSKALNELFKDSDKLSQLISSDTSDEAVSLYKSGNSNINNFIDAYNKVIKYAKNTKDDTELQKLATNMRKYAQKESLTLNKMGISLKSGGTLGISNETIFKNSIANGDLGTYLKEQSNNKTSFLNRIKTIAKKMTYDNTYYLSDDTKNNILQANKHFSNSQNTSAQSVINILA